MSDGPEAVKCHAVTAYVNEAHGTIVVMFPYPANCTRAKIKIRAGDLLYSLGVMLFSWLVRARRHVSAHSSGNSECAERQPMRYFPFLLDQT